MWHEWKQNSVREKKLHQINLSMTIKTKMLSKSRRPKNISDNENNNNMM